MVVLIIFSGLIYIIFVLLAFIIFCCDKTGRPVAAVLLLAGFPFLIWWYYFHLWDIKDSVASLGQMALYCLAYPTLAFVVSFLIVWGIGICRKNLKTFNNKPTVN
jgi:hypothetical protein